MHQYRVQMDPLHEPRRSYWAFFILILVGTLFFLFWHTEEKAIPSIPAEIAVPNPVELLEASVIQSEIPDFSKEF